MGCEDASSEYDRDGKPAAGGDGGLNSVLESEIEWSSGEATDL